MFQLSDFYGYCKQNDVDVMPFAMLPRAACTVRDGQNYAVVLNFKRLHTVRQMRTAMLHESGHLHTGALHKVNSPFQLVELTGVEPVSEKKAVRVSPGAVHLLKFPQCERVHTLDTLVAS